MKTTKKVTIVPRIINGSGQDLKTTDIVLFYMINSKDDSGNDTQEIIVAFTEPVRGRLWGRSHMRQFENETHSVETNEEHRVAAMVVKRYRERNKELFDTEFVVGSTLTPPEIVITHDYLS